MNQAQYQQLEELREKLKLAFKNFKQNKLGAYRPEWKDKLRELKAAWEKCNALLQNMQTSDVGKLSVQFFGDKEKESEDALRYLEETAAQESFKGRISIEKTQAKDAEELRDKHKIDQVPTIIFLRDGREIARHTGEVSQGHIFNRFSMMAEGGSFSDSGDIDTLEDEQKTLSDREIVSMGDFVMLYYDAVWSGVCKMAGPMMETAVEAHGNKIKFEKFDVNYRPQIAAKYGVTHVPSTVFIFKGQEVGRITGHLEDQAQIDKIVEQFLDNEKAPTIKSKIVDPIPNLQVKDKDKKKDIAKDV